MVAKEREKKIASNAKCSADWRGLLALFCGVGAHSYRPFTLHSVSIYRAQWELVDRGNQSWTRDSITAEQDISDNVTRSDIQKSSYPLAEIAPLVDSCAHR
ncbi:hypothetical protein CDAR_508501 [Caerostris darwini]|uniref:Uncharacterized protein n=1 Tax=Caerostris darwini TaxID=1538125 RepID=A0AAV4N043_9ARAC|nr:hypothetical protein CDAR_508501 [Caerostris darwini]